MRNSLILKIWTKFGKVGAETSYLQSQMHSDYDSASIADSDLEDGEQQKMLTSRLWILSNANFTEETCCTVLIAKRRTGKTHSRVLFSNTADPSHLGRSLLEGNKDHLLSQARSELMRQEHPVGSHNNSISELQQQAYAQRLELQDAETLIYWISTRNKFVYKKNNVSRKRFSQILRIRSMREMREMKRAHELRVDEVSLQKLRENHETIQKLTSQFQDNAKNRWILWIIRENFKKWNQITVGDCLTFPVSLQWFQVLFPCWAATNACHLTHGMRLDHRKTFFGNQFSTFDSSRNHPQGIHNCTTPRDTRISYTGCRDRDSFRKRWQTK